MTEDSSQVRTLHEGGFLTTQSNIILVGGTDTAKPHLSVAIARQLVRSGKRCRYFNLVDLVNPTLAIYTIYFTG